MARDGAPPRGSLSIDVLVSPPRAQDLASRWPRTLKGRKKEAIPQASPPKELEKSPSLPPLSLIGVRVDAACSQTQGSTDFPHCYFELNPGKGPFVPSLGGVASMPLCPQASQQTDSRSLGKNPKGGILRRHCHYHHPSTCGESNFQKPLKECTALCHLQGEVT